jgi:hypothetical protein
LLVSMVDKIGSSKDLISMLRPPKWDCIKIDSRAGAGKARWDTPSLGAGKEATPPGFSSCPEVLIPFIAFWIVGFRMLIREKGR